MPKRKDLQKILLIGSGPIVIGQACEFDYSGSQACRALKEEGYQVVLVNSNPATIMTDPEMADRVYIEPLNSCMLQKIIERERPQALLPTLGGQTGLNLAVFLAREGILDKYRVEALGTSIEAISRAEDRDLFRRAMQEIGVRVPQSGIARSVPEALQIAREIGYPLILRPAYTLGGSGGGTAYNVEELQELSANALAESPFSQVLVEESVLGWKEIEFEILRDKNDNTCIITSMENIDPMGVHTGDSIVVAPAQTLPASQYFQLTDLCRKIIRKIDVRGGGANIQFAVNPENGDIVIIEVNPRLSRSSALASKATGYPIARVATKLAVGYTLEEIKNDITGTTPAFMEPAVDYCIIKIPRFAFEKFPEANPVLTTSMKAIGETMAIGRSFNEALQKGLRSLEIGRAGWGADGKDLTFSGSQLPGLREKLRLPGDQRLFYVRYALQAGLPPEEIASLTGISLWFIENMAGVLLLEKKVAACRDHQEKIPASLLQEAKFNGLSDRQLAYLLHTEEAAVKTLREKNKIKPVFKLVDTCAGEFFAQKPYYYSTYENQDESRVSDRKKVVILGGGPNRIGQGIEFDYCCVHASLALREEGCESIMINSNPETVSTDNDISDRLYFEPLTREDVLHIIEKEKPQGIIVQFGGQTPLSLAVPLHEAGVNILGTTPECIDRAEDREKFNNLLARLDLNKPANGTGASTREAQKIASRIGFPVLVRPSYVLGGRAMQIVYDSAELENFMENAVAASPDYPVLIEHFLEDALEVDVDAVCDGESVVVAGIMEHIEEAGVHSGDSACVLPPYSLTEETIEQIKNITGKLALELGVRGLMNVQYAIRNDIIYVLEVNPRASRTVPFVSKATGVPWAKVATRVMLGRRLKELGLHETPHLNHVAVKEAVFPFNRFPGVDAILGPEMKSTGEVMGLSKSFGAAFAKSQLAAGQKLPQKGTVFISVKNQDKRQAVFIAKKLFELGFSLAATRGTARVLRQNDLEVREALKLHEGRPHVIDLLKNGEIQLIINTPSGNQTNKDQKFIRSYAVTHAIPLITTLPGAWATINGLESLLKSKFDVVSLQEYHQKL